MRSKETFFLLLFSFSIFAEVELEEIRVRATHVKPKNSIESNISEAEIGASDIENSLADSIDEIISGEAGVTTNGGPRSSAEEPQIRGLDSKKLFIYLDGGKQSFQSAHSSMVPINPNLLKKVKIHKSNFSSLNGVSSGGGIFFETKDPEDFLGDKKKGYEAAYQYQKENAGNSYDLSFFEDKGSYKYLTNIGFVTAQDFRLSSGEILKNSAHDDYSIFLKTSHRDNWKYTLDLFQRDDTSPINPSVNPPADLKEDNGTHRLNRYGLSLAKKDSEAKVSLSVSKLDQRKKRNSDNEEELRSITTLTTNYTRFLKLNNKNIRLGNEFVYDELEGERESKDIASYPEGSSFLASFFGEADILSSKWATITIGHRIDHLELKSDSDKATKNRSYGRGKFGIEARPDPKLTLLLHYSEGVNMPRIQDVYVDGLHFPGDIIFSDNNFIPNESLEPELSQNIEVGFSFQSQLFSDSDFFKLSVQFYENLVRRYILREIILGLRDFDEPSTTQFINISKARLSGQEVKIEYLYDQFKLLGTYSHLRARNLGERIWIPDAPADEYTLSLSLDASETFSYGLTAQWAQEQPRVNPQTFDPTNQTDSYVVGSIFALKKFQNGLHLSARVENVTDQEYRRHGSFIAEKGQDLKLKLKYKHFF